MNIDNKRKKIREINEIEEKDKNQGIRFLGGFSLIEVIIYLSLSSFLLLSFSLSMNYFRNEIMNILDSYEEKI